MLTGEPVPAEVGPGDAVTGGWGEAAGPLVVHPARGWRATPRRPRARARARAEPRQAPGQRPAGGDGDEVVGRAGGGEEASEPPIAAAIAAGARDRLRAALPAVRDFTNIQGLGVSGVVGGHAVAVGRAGWLESEWAMAVPAPLAVPRPGRPSPGRGHAGVAPGRPARRSCLGCPAAAWTRGGLCRRRG